MGEKQGRRHSSTVTVVVVGDSRPDEGTGVVDRCDVRVDTYRDSGAGGQHRNKTDSAVRLTHIPSGVVVTATESRSQFENRREAWARLEAALAADARLRAAADENLERSAVFGGARCWTWCGWRDEVLNPLGERGSMRRVLRGNFGRLLG